MKVQMYAAFLVRKYGAGITPISQSFDALAFKDGRLRFVGVGSTNSRRLQREVFKHVHWVDALDIDIESVLCCARNVAGPVSAEIIRTKCNVWSWVTKTEEEGAARHA